MAKRLICVLQHPNWWHMEYKSGGNDKNILCYLIATPPPPAEVNCQLPISHWVSFRSMIYSLLLTALNQQPLGYGLPVWYLHLVAPWIASPVSYIYNLFYNSSVVPVQWKLSSITPVPKINKPVDCADFRLISVTPVLSRIYERYIDRRNLYPVLVHPDFRIYFMTSLHSGLQALPRPP